MAKKRRKNLINRAKKKKNRQAWNPQLSLAKVEDLGLSVKLRLLFRRNAVQMSLLWTQVLAKGPPDHPYTTAHG